jgi:hypothetical protein
MRSDRGGAPPEDERGRGPAEDEAGASGEGPPAAPYAAASLLLGHAANASFGEIRNVLTALLGNVVLARGAASDLEVRVRADASGARGPDEGWWLEVPATIGELHIALVDVDETATRLKSLVAALEALSLPTAQPTGVAALLDAAGQLAHHMTKLVGGVRVRAPEGSVGLGGRGGATLAVLSALLSTLAGRMARGASWCGIDLDTSVRPDALVFAARAPLADAELAAVAAELRPLLPGPDLRLRAAHGAIELELALGAARPPTP